MKIKSIMQFVIACAIVMSFPTSAGSPAAAETQSISDTQDLTILRTPDGKAHTLQEYTNQGKWLVVMFWAYDCSACNAEAKNYNELHNRRKKTDLELLGISVDGWKNKDESNKFIQRHKLNFPNLIGENEYISAMFSKLSGRNLIGTPAIFIYDPKGELKAAEIGAVPISLIENFVAGDF